MASGRTINHTLAELRALARNRASRGSEVAPLLTRLLLACKTLAIEERANGHVFRLQGQPENGSTPFLLTCSLHGPTASGLLTRAEAAVAEQLCEGRTLAQIARLRGVSTNTIKSQVRQIFRKLDVDSRVALVRRMCP